MWIWKYGCAVMELALKIIEILEGEKQRYFEEYLSYPSDENRSAYYTLRNIIDKIREELLK